MYISITAKKLLRNLGLFSCVLLISIQASGARLSPEEFTEDDIEIIEGKEQTVFEYRQNGYLMMIKIVPKVGKPYYMVPADGSAHYSDLDHKKSLYPQWVIFEW